MTGAALTADQVEALEAARALAKAGVPLFVAYPGPAQITGFQLPPGWQKTRANEKLIDAWRPGLALCAVMGQGLDLIDIDPRNGGDIETLRQALGGQLPRIYADAATPSGGRHLFIASLGLRSRDAFLPGVDFKGGDAEGRGRGFAFVAPTVRRSKVTGELAAYGWLKPPSAEELGGIAEDRSGQALRRLLEAQRSGAAAEENGAGAGDRVSEGERNATLTRLAGAMRRHGAPEAAIASALLADNAARCDPPLPEAEVRRIAASISKYSPSWTPAARDDSGSAAATKATKATKVALDWPAPPGEAAFQGLAGEVVALLSRYTEADHVALLAHFLAYFAAAVGNAPHAMVGATRHAARDFFAIVGRTAKSRKGDSEQGPRRLVLAADPSLQVAGGLSTGEGLIYTLRDPVLKGSEVVDDGVADKRLLVIEPELARVLRVAGRQGNTLSPVLRDAWDERPLRVMTRSNPLKASGAHLVLVGHITLDELRRELTEVETANGFANRWLFLCVRRGRDIPEPELFEGPAVNALINQVHRRLEFARRTGRMERDEAGRALWREMYTDLAAEREGLVGAVTARAEAHVLRLSLLYALLDGAATVGVGHLHAAVELWAFAERSAEYIFGDASGDPVADRIARALQEYGELTRTQLRDLFGRHVAAGRIDASLQGLRDAGKVHGRVEQTGGRPSEVWGWHG